MSKDAVGKRCAASIRWIAGLASLGVAMAGVGVDAQDVGRPLAPFAKLAPPSLSGRSTIARARKPPSRKADTRMRSASWGSSWLRPPMTSGRC